MKPDVGRLLEVAVGHLMGETVPLLGRAHGHSAYEQSNVRALAMLLMAVRHEHERAAARRVEENRELRRIFASGGAVVGAVDLAERLAVAAEAEDTDLTISALEESNMELRGLLIELHAAVEEIDSPAARTLEEEIWRELAASTRRRALPMLGDT
ncbi:MAG: hypothetical protein IH866_02070 [Chloroflexi bacterium]|nr:hypothetical protein [Chloroflexota bacterium]